MGLAVSEEGGPSLLPCLPFWREPRWKRVEDSIFDSQVTQLDVWEPEQCRILTSKGVSGVLRRTCHIKGFKQTKLDHNGNSRRPVLHVKSISSWLEMIPCAWPKVCREERWWCRREQKGRQPELSEAMLTSGRSWLTIEVGGDKITIGRTQMWQWILLPLMHWIISLFSAGKQTHCLLNGWSWRKGR